MNIQRRILKFIQLASLLILFATNLNASPVGPCAFPNAPAGTSEECIEECEFAAYIARYMLFCMRYVQMNCNQHLLNCMNDGHSTAWCFANDSHFATGGICFGYEAAVTEAGNDQQAVYACLSRCRNWEHSIDDLGDLLIPGVPGY